MTCGQAVAAQKRKLAIEDFGEEAETSTPHPMAALLQTIQVVVVERQKELVGHIGNISWATARIKQLVVLRNMTVGEVVCSIGLRILKGKCVRAM